MLIVLIRLEVFVLELEFVFRIMVFTWFEVFLDTTNQL